jgi:hypothetical protein
MNKRIHLEILPQPDETTCGPTCLHAVYRYYGDNADLMQVIRESPSLEEGGTLAAFLAGHALRRGYSASIYTYNMRVFDPTWFNPSPPDLIERLKERSEHKRGANKLRRAIQAYIDVLEKGGQIRFEDLTPDLIMYYLNRSTPILTGLSATYLYRCKREYGPQFEYDDVRGDPQGHFVILSGYDRVSREVLVADPLYPNPLGKELYYRVNISRVIGAILLGVLTYDANLLIVEPKGPRGR